MERHHAESLAAAGHPDHPYLTFTPVYICRKRVGTWGLEATHEAGNTFPVPHTWVEADGSWAVHEAPASPRKALMDHVRGVIHGPNGKQSHPHVKRNRDGTIKSVHGVTDTPPLPSKRR